MKNYLEVAKNLVVRLSKTTALITAFIFITSFGLYTGKEIERDGFKNIPLKSTITGVQPMNEEH